MIQLAPSCKGVFNLRKIGPLAVLLVFYLVQPVVAQNGDGNQARIQVIGLEIFIFLMFGIIIALNVLSHQKIGNSIITHPFIYYLLGILVTILARVLLIINNAGGYELSIPAELTYYNILITISLIIFFRALRKLSERTKDVDITPLGTRDYLAITVYFIVPVIILILAGNVIPSDELATVVSNWGTIVVFLFAAFLGIRSFWLLKTASDTSIGRISVSVARPLATFLTISAVIYFISLFAGIWEVINLSNYHLVEQILWLIAFIVLTVGYLLVYFNINTLVEETEDEDLDRSRSNVSFVLAILENHLGSLAEAVFIKSCETSGLAPESLNKKNISKFAEAVEEHSKDLLGEFPARYLKINVQESMG